jgi:hypothetical protein
MLIDEMAFTLGKEEGRADVVAVNEYLHCFEIKSDADSLDRLKRQVRLYGKVMNFLSVVTTPKHTRGATKKLPAFWGIYTFVDGTIKPERYPSINEGVCVRSQAGLLWKNTAFQLLTDEGRERGMATKAKGVLHNLIFDVVARERIQEAVCRQFRSHRRSI